MADIQIPEVFTNTKLWVRLVDKRGRMKALLDASQLNDPSDRRKATERLGAIFREEIAGYGGFYFNTSNVKVPEYWAMRNKLNPVLNSLLFLPSIKVTIENNEAEGDNVTFENRIDLNLSEIVPRNLNINETQIGTIQAILDKINSGIPDYPLRHQDLKSIIRINSFEVKWITDSFLTQEATLSIFFEHFQLLKTQFGKELMRPNKRIKVETKFYNIFDGWSHIEIYSFMKSLGYDELSIMPIESFKKKYDEFIKASNENENTDWVIYNFDTDFDDNNGVMLNIKLVKHAMPVLQQKSFQNIKPINLLTKEVIDYFNDIEVIKISDDSAGVGKIFIPKQAMDNNDNSKSRNSNLNLTKTTYMVLDAGRFIMYLLWLYASKYKEYYDETEGSVNKTSMSKNFLVTFEMDITEINKTNKLKERYNGCLMSYINSSSLNKPIYKSLGLFDFNKVNLLFRNPADASPKYTDVAFEFLNEINQSVDSVNFYQWSFNNSSQEFKNAKLNISNYRSNYLAPLVFSSLLTEFPQENFLESLTLTAFGGDTEKEPSPIVEVGEVSVVGAGRFKKWDPLKGLVSVSEDEARRVFEASQLQAGLSDLMDQFSQESSLRLAREQAQKATEDDEWFYSLCPNGFQAEYVLKTNIAASDQPERFNAAWARHNARETAAAAGARKKDANKSVASVPVDFVLQKRVNMHYTFPLIKMAVSDDCWLEQFDKPVGSFVSESLVRLFNTRKNAMAHYSFPVFKIRLL